MLTRGDLARSSLSRSRPHRARRRLALPLCSLVLLASVGCVLGRSGTLDPVGDEYRARAGDPQCPLSYEIRIYWLTFPGGLEHQQEVRPPESEDDLTRATGVEIESAFLQVVGSSGYFGVPVKRERDAEGDAETAPAEIREVAPEVQWGALLPPGGMPFDAEKALHIEVAFAEAVGEWGWADYLAALTLCTIPAFERHEYRVRILAHAPDGSRRTVLISDSHRVIIAGVPIGLVLVPFIPVHEFREQIFTNMFRRALVELRANGTLPAGWTPP
jgi:hypothetical protein